MESIGSPWMWGGFIAFVLAMLALDLGVFHRQAHKVSVREAAVWSVVWVGLALAFNAILWKAFGPQRGMEFLTGYQDAAYAAQYRAFVADLKVCARALAQAA